MIRANFKTYHNYMTDSLYQWDINQELNIYGLNLLTAPEVHFSNSNMSKAIVRQSTLKSGVVNVRIPNSILQDPLTVKAHVGVYEGETFKVVEVIEIPVVPKNKPLDYSLVDDDEEIHSFRKLENQIANLVSGEGGNQPLELMDVRVDYKGRRHVSAGEAVRTQTEELSKRIDTLNSGGLELKEDVISEQVKTWLDDHPEATTTVQDGSLELKSLTKDTQLNVTNDYIVPEMFGAIGDGENDDTEALQNTIDIAERDKKEIVLTGVYKVTDALHIWKGVRISGKPGATIHRYGTNKDAVFGVSAILILDRLETGDYAYTGSQQIRNIILKTDGEKTVQYGIYSDTPCPYTEISKISISGVAIGISYQHGNWCATLRDITIETCNIGIEFLDTGTSFNMSNVYVMTASEYAYRICGLSYSTLTNLCTDWTTGICYSFEHCNLSVDGFGSEGINAKKVVNCINSKVILNDGLIFSLTGAESQSLLSGQGSILTMKNCKIGHGLDHACKFVDMSTNFDIILDSCVFEGEFTQENNTNAYYNVITIKGSKGEYSKSLLEDMPYLGKCDMYDKYYRNSPFKDNMFAIYGDVLQSPSKGSNVDRAWYSAKNIGDLFVNTAPTNGIALYQQTSDCVYRNVKGTIANIDVPNNTLILSDMGIEENESLYGTKLEVGNVLKNGWGHSIITAVDESNKRVTVESLEPFHVGDSLQTRHNHNYMRDSTYRGVQQVLAIPTANRSKIVNPPKGLHYFDTTLNKPVWWNGSNWVDATGATV